MVHFRYQDIQESPWGITQKLYTGLGVAWTQISFSKLGSCVGVCVSSSCLCWLASEVQTADCPWVQTQPALYMGVDVTSGPPACVSGTVFMNKPYPQALIKNSNKTKQKIISRAYPT